MHRLPEHVSILQCNAQSQHGFFKSVSYIWLGLTWRWHSPRPLPACSSPSWVLRAGARAHWCSSAPAGRRSENRTLTLCTKIELYHLIFLDIHIGCNGGSLVGKLCKILHSNKNFLGLLNCLEYTLNIFRRANLELEKHGLLSHWQTAHIGRQADGGFLILPI